MDLVISLLGPSLGMIAIVVVNTVGRERMRRAAPPTAVSLGAIESQRQGPVRVTGTIRADQWKLVNARYSGRPGVVAVAERWRRAGSRRSRRLDRDQRGVAFSIDDGTGRARLRIDFADYAVALSPVQLDPAKHGSDDLLEAVLVPGDRVTVVGTIRRMSDGALELFGTPESHLVVSAR